MFFHGFYPDFVREMQIYEWGYSNEKYCIKRIGGKRHMTLKEAFTYQNFLEEIITKGETYLMQILKHI